MANGAINVTSNGGLTFESVTGGTVKWNISSICKGRKMLQVE